jgi:hypothetical protein
METPVTEFQLLIEEVEEYSKTTIELAITRITVSLIYRLCSTLIFLLAFLLLTIGIALLLGDLLGKPYYGFFIVAAFYLVAALLFHFFLHQWIKNPISKLIITQALQLGTSWKK